MGKIQSGSSDCQPARGGEVTLAGKLITESDVLALPKSGVATLRLGCGQLITPLAVDALKARGMGDVICPNVCGTGVDVIATKTVE